MTPVLETERLLLRPYTPDDREHVVALFTDPEVARYVGAGVQTEEEAERGFGRIFTHVYATGAFDVWGVFAKGDGAYVGHAEIKPRRDALARPGDHEIIYVLARPSWGRGFATELARRVVEYGFSELRLARICATVDPDNAASIHVLEKLGMRYEEEFTDETGWTLVYVVEA
jgi:RimJ/RimL family protein N-acetyltransferase